MGLNFGCQRQLEFNPRLIIKINIDYEDVTLGWP
jgi:hypothetical protein